MVGGRVGFLVAGLWEGVRGIIEKVIFRPAILPHVGTQCRITSLLLLWRFSFFSGPGRSRASQACRDGSKSLSSESLRLCSPSGEYGPRVTCG